MDAALKNTIAGIKILPDENQRDHKRFSESPFRRLKGLHAPLNPVSSAGLQKPVSGRPLSFHVLFP
jgi:hypothetical protein